MQISIKGYITSKESELFYDCADRYAYNVLENKFAISDGVSKSFFPKIWAEVLVNQWVSKKWNTDKELIEQCQKDWLQKTTEIANKPDVKWFTKNAFNRKEPGLATFVGLRFFKKEKEWFWKADALGDSFLFFVSDKAKGFSDKNIMLSSKEETIVFDNFPDYLSSYGNNHKGKKQSKEGQLTSGTFYLMTDALAEWFLSEQNNAINKIGFWRNQQDFERFVDEERINKKLGNDDSAILIINIEDDKNDQLNYVLEQVSDINELVKIQQKELEVSEKVKEEALAFKEENPITEIATEQLQQKIVTEENKASEEGGIESEQPKKGFLEKLFGKKETGAPVDEKEIESEEQPEVKEKNQKEIESPVEGQEQPDQIEKSDNSENGQNQEGESKSNAEPDSNTKPFNKPSQNITDKF